MQADEYPTISPTATYITPNGEEESAAMAGSAPLKAYFRANPENVGNYSATYEWRFYLNSMEGEPYLTRYEEDTEYTFTQAGGHYIVCYATFINGTDTVAYTQEYWTEEGQPLTCTISQSRLEMPNAFSPNDDGINDIYKAKEGYQSLTEFHAYIFNRWGQKLFEWNDPAQGWDGKYNGHPVKQGVYYVLVKAKGADGIKYNIRKDVNLLRGYTEKDGSNGNTQTP
jgi:gliding motility-associated-like protein